MDFTAQRQGLRETKLFASRKPAPELYGLSPRNRFLRRGKLSSEPFLPGTILIVMQICEPSPCILFLSPFHPNEFSPFERLQVARDSHFHFTVPFRQKSRTQPGLGED